MTRRDDTTERDITRRDSERSGRDRTTTGLDPDELFALGELERATYPSDVDRIVAKLHREVERKMRIERERRGL